MTGEIRVDGKPRSYRDTKSGSMDAATFLKRRQPHSEVAVTSGTATQTETFLT
jgi:hypothetical protein